MRIATVGDNRRRRRKPPTQSLYAKEEEEEEEEAAQLTADQLTAACFFSATNHGAVNEAGAKVSLVALLLRPLAHGAPIQFICASTCRQSKESRRALVKTKSAPSKSICTCKNTTTNSKNKKKE